MWAAPSYVGLSRVGPDCLHVTPVDMDADQRGPRVTSKLVRVRDRVHVIVYCSSGLMLAPLYCALSPSSFGSSRNLRLASARRLYLLSVASGRAQCALLSYLLHHLLYYLEDNQVYKEYCHDRETIRCKRT